MLNPWPVHGIPDSPHELAVPQRHHTGGARFTQKQCHLADHIAGDRLVDEPPLPVGLGPENTQPSGQHDIEPVGRIALRE
jgi:hypothetical protein